MIRILHSVSNMDRAGIETMLMNYSRYRDAAVAASTGDIPSVGHRVQHAWRYAWWTVLQVGKKVHERLSK